MTSQHAFFDAARLRRALLHFLAGKGITAPLTFLILLMLVRWMPVSDYGAYVTSLAIIEIAIALSDLGMNWVVTRFLPAYAVAATKSALTRITLAVIAVRGATLVVTGLVIWQLAGLVARLAGLDDYVPSIGLVAALLAVDGVGRLIRDAVLQSLLLQGRAQLANMCRTALFAGLLALAWWQGGTPLELHTVLLIELTAALASALLAIGMLLHALAHREATPQPGWTPPRLARLFQLAWPNYVGVLLMYVSGPDGITMLINRAIGPDGAAAFGVARHLSNQLRRYLPSELFVGVLRPAIIASFELSRDFSALNRQAQALYKTSLVALLPILLVAAGLGGAWLSAITGGKTDNAHVLLLLMVCLLVPFTQRRVLEMVMNTVDLADLWLRAALASCLVLPVAFVLLRLGAGVESLVALMLASEIAINGLIVQGLRSRGWAYRIALARSATTVMLCIALGLGVWLLLPSRLSLPVLLGASALLAAVALALAWRMRVIDESEMAMMRVALRRTPKTSE